MVSFERGAQNNGKTRRATFFSHSLGEMSLGKSKFSMGDVIHEFKSGAKMVIFLEPMRFGPQNLGSPSEIYPPFD